LRSHPQLRFLDHSDGVVVVLSAFSSRRNERTIEPEEESEDSSSSPYDKLRRFRIIQKALLLGSKNDEKYGNPQRQPLQLQLDLIELECLGRTHLPQWKRNDYDDERIDCCVLGASKSQTYQQKQQQSCLLLPIANPSHFQLLEWIRRKNKKQQQSYISKQQLLTLNGIVLNRDRGLFDNLPYEWCQQTNTVDAANNPIERKFQLGKRIFYNQMAGQDWYRDWEMPLMAFPSSSGTPATTRITSTSPMIQDLWKQLQSQLTTMPLISTKRNNNTQSKEDNDNNQSNDNGTMILYDDFDDESFTKSVLLENRSNNIIDTEKTTTTTLPRALMKRILELRIREIAMDIADVESQMAQKKQMQQISSTADDEIANLQQQQTSLQAQMNQYRLQLSNLSLSSNGKAFSSSSSMDVLVGEYNNNVPSERKDLDKNARRQNKKYSSPYHFLQHLVNELMQAEIIGGFLENASLIHSESSSSSSSAAVTLGGGIVLQKKSRTNAKTTVETILGERVVIRDDPSDAESIPVVVECDADEAVGLCTALGIPLLYLVDESMMTESSKLSSWVAMTKDIDNDVWKPVDDAPLSILYEGQKVPANVSAAPVRLPLFSSLDDAGGVPTTTSSSSLPLFPTDNPIKSLSAYDALSMEDKARVLVTLSNFNGREQRLPRPRNLRNDPTLLDELLVPLIDESVRSQYRIRQAQKNGDLEEMQRLQASRSRRVLAQQRAEDLYARGDIETAQYYESEAAFLESLRADPTQDEGSYSRFLDRDEWYERNRRRNVPDKSKFGNLLDGVE
jgi:hypothetical protein